MVAPLLHKRFEMVSLVVYATKLPPAPQVFGRIIAAIKDGECSLGRLAELIRLDAALTVQVLRVANGALSGFRSPAGSVEEAVLRIGFKELHRVVGLCAASAVYQADMAVYAAPADRVWANAVATAVAMERLCAATGSDAALGYTARLLRCIGKMALARHAAGAVIPYPADGTPLPDWETRTFGYNHAQIGAALCELWRFPKPIVGAIRDQLHPSVNPGDDTLARLLNLAGGIAVELDCGLPGEEHLWTDAAGRAAQAGLDPIRLEILRMETSLETDRMKSMVEFIRQG